MAKSTVVARVLFNRFGELRGQLRQRAGQVVRKTALDIEARAKAAVPVDTGTLKNSIQAEQVEAFSWQVGTPVEYAPYVEYGTSRAAAQPYLGPAAEAARGPFEQAMKQLLD